MANLIRVNIRVSEKIKKYFEEKSDETGVSQSSLMALALEEYMDQKNMVKFSSNFENYINKIQKTNKSKCLKNEKM